MPFARRPAEAPTVTPGDEVAPPDLPECTADMVTFDVVTDEEVLGGNAGISAPENRNLALMARPGESCGLSAWPTVRLATDGGNEELVPEPAATQPRVDRLILTGLQRVVGIVRWLSSCAPAGVEVRAEGQLAGGDRLSTPLPDPPACDPTVQNMAGFWMVFPAQPPPSPLVAELVDVPSRAPFDGTLRVVVEVLNSDSEALSLDPCPIYSLSYGESGTSVHATFELNCPAAPEEVPAGGRLRFATQLDLPAEEIPHRFVGSFTVAVYIDGGHRPAYASTELETE